MGPGHLAIAMAAKPSVPKIPLLALLAASEALDILCFAFSAMGIENLGQSATDLARGVQVIVPGSIAWSHGLFMSVVWSAAAFTIAYLIYRDYRHGLVLGGVVFSHWLLDFIVHPADLPLLFSGSPRVGLGLWTSPTGLVISAVLEIALLGAGGTIYFLTRRKSRL